MVDGERREREGDTYRERREIERGGRVRKEQRERARKRERGREGEK